MFASFRREDPQLTAAITECYKDLEGHTAESKEYKEAMKQLEKLHSLKPKQLDPNTVAIVIANLVIGWRVLKFEDTGVITTKLWNFLTKT